jgi:serine/threonine-protein kinase
MPDTNNCPHCGQAHRESARFCPNTGLPIVFDVVEVVSPDIPIGQTGKLPPKTVLNGRYVLLSKIGQGGMAAVYKATDNQDPSTIWAVKEMSDSAITDPEERSYAVQCFHREAHLLQMLDHKNLPKVVDVFTEGSKHYLVMEFVPGESLEALYISRREPFPEDDLLPWAYQLCDVLAYLHARNPPIIFRDLKPSNIMITPDDQVKLIDFGIVRFFKPGKDRDTLALGTPGYTPPEGISGQTDERSDIYSLCVTLHQLLTGHNPVKSLFNLPPAREVNPAVSEDMDRILRRGTQSQPAERWSSAEELRAALLTAFPIQTPAAQSNAPLVVPIDGRAVQARQVKADSAQEPLKTSRPTQRLILAASQLSTWQIAALIVAFIALLVGATWALAPVLDQLDFEWNNVPIMAMFGIFGYALYPRRGSVLVSHVLLTGILIATIYLRLGDQGYTWQEFALAIAVSGVFMEVWAALLPFIKGNAGNDAWKRELVWLMIMEIIGIALFLGLLTKWESGLTPLQWGLSALFAGIGWFMGDLIRQYLLYRKTGLRGLK